MSHHHFNESCFPKEIEISQKKASVTAPEQCTCQMFHSFYSCLQEKTAVRQWWEWGWVWSSVKAPAKKATMLSETTSHNSSTSNKYISSKSFMKLQSPQHLQVLGPRLAIEEVHRQMGHLLGQVSYRGVSAPGSEPLPHFRESRPPKKYLILGKIS